MTRIAVHMCRIVSVLALLVSGLNTHSSAPIAQAAGLAVSSAAAACGCSVRRRPSPLFTPIKHTRSIEAGRQVIFGPDLLFRRPTVLWTAGSSSSYGTDKNYEDRTGTFLQDVGGSAWYGTLSQYWDRDQNGQQVPVFNESTLGGTWEDNSDYPNLGRGAPAATLQPADIQREIGKAVQQNGWNVTPDSLFFVFIPEEVQACDPNGLCTNSATHGNACGFHSTTAVTNGQQVGYAVIPSPGDSGCDHTITSPSNDLVVDNAIDAVAHELVEAVTDPEWLVAWSDPVANKTDVGGEVGDKCEDDFPGRGDVLPDGGNITLNGHDYILQSIWSDLDGGCTFGRVAVPYLDAQGIKTLQVEDGSPSILITGHNFSPTAAVQWNGTPIPTTMHSSQALGASIPAGDLAKPGVAVVTVTQQGTTGGTSNPQFVYVTQSGAVLTDEKAVTNFSGTTSIGTAPNLLTVTASGGTGALGLAQFGGNPAGGDTSGTTNSYFDVYASPGDLSGLTIEDCALNGGNLVAWYDPAAGWKAASKQTYNAAMRCATVIVDTTTTPSLSQLQTTSLGGWSRAPSSSSTSTPVPMPTPASNGTGASSPTMTINDTDPGLSYSGGGWNYYPGRPAAVGDLNNDVHATMRNGDSVSYTFKGTGVSYVSERSDGYGTVQVSLDGAVQTVIDANAPGIHNQGNQTLFTVGGLPFGQHTLTLEKTGGVFMLLDDVVVQTAADQQPTNVQLTNDTDPKITYSGGSWAYYNGRPTSVYDIQNDVHAATNNGDSVSYTSPVRGCPTSLRRATATGWSTCTWTASCRQP